MKIMAISGSARKASTNTSLLRALSAAAPLAMKIKVFDKIGTLPVFSPDLEGAETPESVRAYISAIKTSEGLIIVSPDYVRTIPGGLKNAIDWLVSGENYHRQTNCAGARVPPGRRHAGVFAYCSCDDLFTICRTYFLVGAADVKKPE